MGLVLGLLIVKNIDAIFSFIENIVNVFINFIFSLISLFQPGIYIPHFEIFSKSVYYFDKIPVKIYFHEVFFIILFSLIIVFVASFIPARKASIVKPQEVIHNE
jgi:ABC-type lipoprotein release transport system permease subunit